MPKPTSAQAAPASLQLSLALDFRALLFLALLAFAFAK
jgi:hypothetical protein